MSHEQRFLNNRVCLNVLGNSLENAKDIFEAAQGHVLVGLLSKTYPSVDVAVKDMNRYMKEIDGAVSVGLGAGDPKQWKMVADIAKEVQPQHVNQVCTATGYTRGLLGQNDTYVNSLLSPTGKVGYVNMATGEFSSQVEQTLVPIDTAIVMLKEMGANSVKFYPMNGLSTRDEFVAVCEACARHDFMVEPTGSLDLENFEEILQIALDAGVPKVIPHVYSSVIDPVSKDTRIEDVKTLYEIMKRLV